MRRRQKPLAIVTDTNRSLTRIRYGLLASVVVLVVGLLALALIVGEKFAIAGSERAELRADLLQQSAALDKANDRLIDAGEKPVAPPVTGVPGIAGATGQRGPRGHAGTDGQDGKPGPRGATGSERQQPEVQDPEVPDAEPDNPDPNDPEVQDPEIQDPEVDDPDPNSALDFRVDNQCNPPDGTVVADVNLTIERSPGVVTFILNCTTADPPGPVTTP